MINLATETGFEQYEICSEECSLEDFIATGKYNLRFGKTPVVTYDGDFYTITNNIIAWTGAGSDIRVMPEGPDAVILPQKSPRIVQNADVGSDKLEGMPSVSFRAVQKLLDPKIPSGSFNFKDTLPVAVRFAHGSLKIVAFTEDQRIKVKKTDKKPPAVGFTLLGNILLGNVWHRSGTVLVYDTKKKKTYLLGQDEGSYFGVELKDNPKTIDAAFKSLTPKEVHNAKCKRQGEWFLIPVDNPPENIDCLWAVKGDGGIAYITLPIDHPDSNKHIVDCDEAKIDKNQTLFVLNPVVHHAQHDTVSMDGWCMVLKNTAVRSVSQEGVD